MIKTEGNVVKSSYKFEQPMVINIANEKQNLVGMTIRNSELRVGISSSNSAGYGVRIASDRTAALRVYADDGGVALTTGASMYRGAHVRLILPTAVSAAITVAGMQSQLKLVANTVLDWAVAHWAYLETVATISIGGSAKYTAALRCTLDVPTGVTIATNGIAAGIIIDSISLAGTHTGKASMICIPNPGAGEWDYFLDFGSAPGAIVADTTNIPAAATHKIKCRINATDFYLIGVADF